MEHCFTASVTTHLSSILSVSALKMSSFGRMEALRRALHQLCYQLHSAEGRAKCPTVPQCHELVTGTCDAEQGSK